MSKPKNLDALLKIVSPCSEDWNSMTGNEQVRFCSHCNLKVHNLSQMTRQEAQELAEKSNGRLCVRYHQSQKKTILFKPLPVQIHRVQRRVSRVAAGAFSVALSFSSVAAQTPGDTQPTVVSSLEVPSKDGHDQAPSQGGTASLQGIIKDQSEAVIAGVEVKITISHGYTQTVHKTHTTQNGEYQFPSLESGSYVLEAESEGFKKLTANFSIQNGEDLRLDSTLEVNGGGEMTGVSAISSPIYDLVYHNSERNRESLKDEKIQEFLTAVTDGDVTEVNRLLESGMNVNSANEYGDTALMLGTGSKKMVKNLLAAGAGTKAKNDFGVTALMYSLLNREPPTIKALLSAGADVNAQDMDGRSALIMAALDGSLKEIRILLAAGAKVNAKDKDGKTALTYAREGGHPEVVQLLKLAGARE